MRDRATPTGRDVMRRVLLLCGGRSGEHEVSLASAASLIAAARGRFEVAPVVLGLDGRPLPPLEGRRALVDAADPATATELVSAGADDGDLAALAPLDRAAPHAGFDVVFPLLHGPFGEDGTVQGLLEMADLPYVGSGVLGSAAGMDKPTMKAVFAAHGFPQVGYGVVTRHAFRHDAAAAVRSLDALAWPRFVKPANLGSSVGISRARTPSELVSALALALEHDRRAIVEESVEDARELEVGVLGNEDPEASPVGEIRFTSEFYDYETKYTDGAADLVIPAEIPPAIAERCRSLALAAFAAIDAAGLARVDFFWRPSEGIDGVLLNEINTMPGFTRTSMYPKLWQAAGVPYGDLAERLVDLAIERHAERPRGVPGGRGSGAPESLG